MLLYVDKKKEKYRKIKLLLFILFGIFVLCANFLCFFYALNHTDQSLTKYTVSQNNNDWYKNSQPCYLFASRKSLKKVLLIPQEISRENLITIASIFAKLKMKNQALTVMQKNNPYFSEIVEIARIFFPDLKVSDTNFDLIITPDIKEIADLIKKEHLYPSVFNYQKAVDVVHIKEVMQRIDKFFPLPVVSKNTLEVEKKALVSFLNDNKKILFNLVKHNISPQYSLQNLFLKNVRICMTTKDGIFCKTKNDISLEKSIRDIKMEMPEHQFIEKMIFLTSDEKFLISKKQELNTDEGLHFCYQNRESFLFPEEISSLGSLTSILAKLREKAGINPDYITRDMKFYKFKIVEVDINDSI